MVFETPAQADLCGINSPVVPFLGSLATASWRVFPPYSGCTLQSGAGWLKTVLVWTGLLCLIFGMGNKVTTRYIFSAIPPVVGSACGCGQYPALSEIPLLARRSPPLVDGPGRAGDSGRVFCPGHRHLHSLHRMDASGNSADPDACRNPARPRNPPSFRRPSPFPLRYGPYCPL